jgi:hypothetical protein
VEIGASVKAKKLRFEQVPEVEVEFRGHPGREEVKGSDRENLPDEVEEGVTYNDVQVRWRAAARIVSDEEDPD